MLMQLPIDQKNLSVLCQRWQVAELALFGSILRADFRPDSDVDVLVRFLPEAELSLFDMVQMQAELKQLFGREVDLVSRRGLEASRNYIRKQAILSTAQVVYGA